MQNDVKVGDTVTCAETGKQFIVARDGCSFNYASTSSGEVLSDEGAVIREKRDLLDRSRPYTCYLSSDGTRVTTWKGAVLGSVVRETESRTGFYGSYVTRVRVCDVHGAYWYGQGAGRGRCITLRPCKAPR